MSDWQPIETAPKNGTAVWVATAGAMRVAFWKDGPQYEYRGSVGGGWRDWFAYEHPRATHDLQFTPTNWMPLPAPPVGPEKTKDNSDSALSVSPLEKP